MENAWTATEGSNGEVRLKVVSRFRSALAALSVIDRLTLAYICFVLVVVIARYDHVRHGIAIAIIHLGLIAGIALIALLRAKGNRTAAAVGNWYPILMFGFFFEEIGFIVHAFHKGWFDHWLIAMEYRAFGVHPTVWIEQYSSYWATEILQLVYTSYLFLTFGLAIYFANRDQRTPFQILVISTCVTYYIGYVIFVLFPIESPHHTLRSLQTVELVGGPFTAIINWIERYGRVHGGAFPSAHVSGSVVVLICAWRYARRVGYVLLPVVAGICVATVYGRYHYVVDVIAGILTAAIGYAAGVRLSRWERARKVVSY